MTTILYGAGKNGRKLYSFLKHKQLAQHVCAFCVTSLPPPSEKMIYGLEIPVLPYSEVRNTDAVFIVTPGIDTGRNEITELLQSEGKRFVTLEHTHRLFGIDSVTWERDWVAWFHIQDMDHYFELIETNPENSIFWNAGSPFVPLFNRLNLESVIELACGRGRHVGQYMNRAGHITLVDILQKNIDFCKERFSAIDKISYYCNNGFDLCSLPDASYSALFTYDSMVHFEMMDIFSYLKDIHRVLKPGALALFHHSNNHKTYDLTFANARGGRTYMTKDIFAYLAWKAGFNIVEQQIIDWGEKELDCISLIEKPGVGLPT